MLDATPLVSIEETKRFVTDCLKAVGTEQENALAMAELLAEADKRGHFSHGLNRLGNFVNFFNVMVSSAILQLL